MGGKTKAAAITKKAVAQRKRERAEAKKVKEAARLERARVEREARSPAEQALWLQNEGNPMFQNWFPGSVQSRNGGYYDPCQWG